MCSYFDDIIGVWERDIDFSDILWDEQFYKGKYSISYKTWTGEKPLHIRYNKIDGFIKIHTKIRHLVLFDEWCDKICHRIKYLFSEKKWYYR